MFEHMTHSAIMQRMLAQVPEGMDKREGSVIWDALSPAALELEAAYICMDYTLLQAFADTQDREYLIRRAAERGIAPDPASRAVLKAVFLPEGIDVRGRRFSLGKLNYAVLEPIGEEAGAWLVQCETAGSAGNKAFGSLIPIDYVDGLESAKLTELLIPGEDEQDTESLRAAYYASFSRNDCGGNIAGYHKMTVEQDGVGAAKVTPAWKGGGTLRITILDSTFNAASGVLVENVQAAIDPMQDGQGSGLAFIDHVVTVDTAQEIPVEVNASISFESGCSWETMLPAVTAAVEAYFEQLRRSWSDTDAIVVRIARVEAAILALDGVLDVGGTMLNGAAENLVLDSYAVPVLGGVANAG